MDAPERIWAVPSLGGDWNDDLGMWWNENTGIEPQAKYTRADLCADPALLAEAVEVLRRVSSCLNHAFAAGTEERENGSARRQAKAMEHVEALRADARAFLAKLENRHDR